MLAGVKKGKRKRKNEGIASSGNNGSKKPITSTAAMVGSSSSNRSGGNTKSQNNKNAAAELRTMLEKGKSANANTTSSSIVGPTTSSGTSTSLHASKKEQLMSALERFEQRRVGGSNIASGSSKDNTPSNAETIVIMNGKHEAPILSKEDFRRGARKGKVKQTESYMRSSADQTIAEMVEEEKKSKQLGVNNQSMDETFARNIQRLGSRYKGSDFKMVAGSTAGADEDDGTSIDMKMFTDVADRLTEAESYKREVSRQIALSKKQNSIANKCWWWIESEMFQKHRLIALGDHVSLVLVPSHLQLVKYQCYFVPVKHAESFVSCEDEVWDEIQRFKTSLRQMFKEDKKGVLFCETVLPTKSFWQTRMDIIPVPKSAEQDAQIFFKSALNEQAEEWGTHTKLLSTKGKGLRQTVPRGFSYFNVEWDGGGYAQIIETNSFPKDFGLDTIAGMMDIEPLRFGRKQKAKDGDKSAVMEFVKKFEPFDWTHALDCSGS